MSNEPTPKYVPTDEEIQGDSWAYCYGESAFIPSPVVQEQPDEHRQ